MVKVGMILPYYGELHDYFSLLIHSMGKNATIDFYIISDLPLKYEHEENVKIISMPLDEIRKRASKIFKMCCQLDTPYKLCDYKVAYGLIFEDILYGYDFWGYCDPDAIYGDIRKFITDDILKSYDRILNLGHFTLYRNVPRVNLAFMDMRMPAYSYKEAFRSINTVGFDERGAICCMFSKMNPKQYTNYTLFQDIYPGNILFSSHSYSVEEKIVFLYEKGHLYVVKDKDGIIKREETMYVHLQKRKMDYNISIDNERFFIVPNKFIKYTENLRQIFDTLPDSKVSIKRQEDWNVPLKKKLKLSYIKIKINKKFIQVIKSIRFKILGFHKADFIDITIQQYAEGYIYDFYTEKGYKFN